MFSFTDLVVKSAGNLGLMDGWVTPPGLGYNTLTVGNFNDNNTVYRTDDTMNDTSSWKDPLSAHGDREKPEVVAPGTDITSTTAGTPWIASVGSGTSFSAPFVAGQTALLYQRNSALRAWPESTKAIIMATAIQNKEGATRLSEKDGAGGIWAVEADWVARNNSTHGRWGGDEYDCTSNTPTAWDATTMSLTAGHKTRVVLVWDQNPDYSFYATQPSADLDLQIWRTTSPLQKTPVAESSTWDNTYEIVEFTPSVTGTYSLRINKFRCDLTPGYMGWAWWSKP
jgi:subtilisin family serine protease